MTYGGIPQYGLPSYGWPKYGIPGKETSTAGGFIPMRGRPPFNRDDQDIMDILTLIAGFVN